MGSEVGMAGISGSAIFERPVVSTLLTGAGALIAFCFCILILCSCGCLFSEGGVEVKTTFRLGLMTCTTSTTAMSANRM